jgi:hypothetical protein
MAAVADRQQLAQDIFDVLRKVTGAVDIFANPALRATFGPVTPEYQALRWLAQLSVNVVDYIDEDDYSTPFRWDPLNTTPGDFGWVFGVELPRLTLNEAYAQLDNDNSDASVHTPTGRFASLPYRMNVWLELHNPLPTETFPGRHTHSNPNAQLQLAMQGNPTVPVYQLVLTNPKLFSRALADPANVTGDPSFPATIASVGGAVWAANVVTITTTVPHTFTVGQGVVIQGVGVAGYNGTFQITSVPTPTTFTYNNPAALGPSGGGTATPVAYSVVNNWGLNPALHIVRPANGAYSGPNGGVAGFYVLGAQPPADPNNPAQHYVNAADDPNFPRTLLSTQMSYPVPLAAVTGVPNTMPSVDVVLRRLACPHLPPNNNPAAGPLYNPYITTDMVELVGTNNAATTQVWDSRRFLAGAPPAGDNDNAGLVARANRRSFGRLQPYAAGPTLQRQNPITLPANQPPNTFFQQNAREAAVPPPANIPAGDTLKTSFDWLTHPDRELISPMELLNVSGVKPHELTQFFMRNCTQTLSNYASPHLVSWTSGDGRLYRFFEFVTTGGRQGGYCVNGRVPGKININTWAPPTGRSSAPPATSSRATPSTPARRPTPRSSTRCSPPSSPGGRRTACPARTTCRISAWPPGIPPATTSCPPPRGA